MTKKTKIIFFSIILIQVFTIISLLSYIYLKQNNTLNKISISPIEKESLLFPTLSSLHLKYFYELKPASTRIDSPSWLPYTTTNTINQDGLNERFDYSTEKPQDTFRIITIGDSYTFGAHVNTPDNWTEKLEDLFQITPYCIGSPKIEVINLGVSGYDLEYAVARLKLRGIKYNPDMVMWLAKNDDFSQINEIITPAKNKYRDELLEKGPINPGDYSYTINATNEINKKYGEEAILNRQIEILKSITNIYNNKLVLLTFPFTLQKYKRIMTDFANSNPRTYFYDNLPNIRGPNMSRSQLPDGHPSVEGYSLIAVSAFEYLKTNKLISCR